MWGLSGKPVRNYCNRAVFPHARNCGTATVPTALWKPWFGSEKDMKRCISFFKSIDYSAIDGTKRMLNVEVKSES